MKRLSSITQKLTRCSAIAENRAAGCISFGQKWKTGTTRQYFTDIMGLSSTTVIIGLQKLSNSVKTQTKGYYAVQGHRGRYQSKAICDFLLVINSNWHPISYLFGVTAAYYSNFGHFAFLTPFGLRDNTHVRCSSWAHWKARSGLPISVNWWSLRAKIDRKSAISLQRDQFDPKIQVERVAPPVIFARIVRPMNAL